MSEEGSGREIEGKGDRGKGSRDLRLGKGGCEIESGGLERVGRNFEKKIDAAGMISRGLGV